LADVAQLVEHFTRNRIRVRVAPEDKTRILNDFQRFSCSTGSLPIGRSRPAFRVSRHRVQYQRSMGKGSAAGPDADAVGTEHARWLEEDISAPGVAMLQALFSGVDPGANLNPGKIA
jgi:hypothetical protein